MAVSAPLNTYPRSGFPMSRQELRKAGMRGPMYNFLNRLAFRDTVFSFDDFDQDTINLDRYAVANGGGASAASFAISVQRDGAIRATTGTQNDVTASASLIGPAIYYGDAKCGMEVRWKPVTAATEVRIEMGFVDVVPGSNASVVNSLTTPSVNSSVVDAAIAVYDETSSTVVSELVTIGSSITAARDTYTMPTTVAVGTWNTVRLQLQNNNAYMWVDGVLVANLDAAGTDYIEGGSAVAPWVYIRAKNATSKSVDLDYIAAWQDRNI